MIINNDYQLEQYQQACRISTQILNQLRLAIKPGVTGLEIDQLADKLCQKNQVKPNFKGQGLPDNPYRHATCVSVNEVVVHGIPDDRPFQPGDVIKVDFGIEYQGLNTDHCFTVGLEPLNFEQRRLVTVTQEAIEASARKAIAGNRIGDLSHAIQSRVEAAGFSVAKEFVGHGIGHTMHDSPQIPAFGQPGTGVELRPGMVLCVEAQVLEGDDCVYIDQADGWTVKTCDGGKAAMFEYMVLVGKRQAEFLTPTTHWPLFKDVV